MKTQGREADRRRGSRRKGGYRRKSPGTLSRRHSTELISSSPEETRRIGRRLAHDVRIPGAVLLRGGLGTGKTTFARGVAEGLGLKDGSLVCSPSFTLINTYRGRCSIYHVDLYRLSDAREIRSIGLDDFLEKDGVAIVEWSERLEYPLASAIEVTLEDCGGETRKLTIQYHGARVSPSGAMMSRPRRGAR